MKAATVYRREGRGYRVYTTVPPDVLDVLQAEATADRRNLTGLIRAVLEQHAEQYLRVDALVRARAAEAQLHRNTAKAAQRAEERCAMYPAVEESINERDEITGRTV